MTIELPFAFWICVSYLVVVLIVGILPSLRVSHSVQGYVAGDRGMGVVVLYFVLGAAIYSSFSFLGGPGWAYSRGAAAYFILTYGAAGLLPLYFFGPKARRLGIKHGFVTQAELLAWRFESKGLSVLLALLSVVAFIPYLTLQITGAGYILNIVSDGAVPEWMGGALAYGVVLVYVLKSGVMGVGWTSMLQGIVMMVVAWGLGLYLPWKFFGGVPEMFTAIETAGLSDMLVTPGLDANGQPWNWWGYSSAILVSAIGFSCWPHFFMKAFAARSDKSMKLMVVMYPTFQVFLIPILIIGFTGILMFPGIERADTILPYIITHSGLPALLIGLVCVGTLAASMSSGDAIIHAAGSVAVRDGIKPVFKRQITDFQECQMIKLAALFFTAVAYYFSVYSEISLVALLLGSYGGVAQLFPIVIAAFYWRNATRVGVVGGLLAGISVNIFFLAYPELRPVPLHEGIFGLVANIATLIVLSKFSRKPATARIGDFVTDRLD